MEYRRYTKQLHPSAFGHFASIVAKKDPSHIVQVVVQTVPKGTALPTEDGGTVYTIQDSVTMTLYVGPRGHILSAVAECDLLPES